MQAPALSETNTEMCVSGGAMVQGEQMSLHIDSNELSQYYCLS